MQDSRHWNGDGNIREFKVVQQELVLYVHLTLAIVLWWPAVDCTQENQYIIYTTFGDLKSCH